jgi:hypothetical protein
MEFEFSGTIWYWRGPAPHYFVTVPEGESRALKSVSGSVTYGWGVLPVEVQIGETSFTTSLFPKDGLYIVPIKLAVRQKEHLKEGDEVTVRLSIAI